jgi:hypothetical protein
MSPRAGRGLLAPVALLGLGAGCQLLIGLDGGTPRDAGTGGTSTGGASSTSTSSSPSSTSSSTTSTSTSSTSTSTSSTSTSTTTSSTTSTTTTTTVSARVLLLASGATSTIGGELAGGSWTTATITGATSADAPALAVVPATGDGVGLVHTTSDTLAYTHWNGTSWTSLAQLHTDTTRGAPALAATGSSAYAVFQLPSVFTYASETFTSGAWGATSQPVEPADLTQQACGPSPPAIAPFGALATLVYVNGGACGDPANDLRGSDLGGTGWKTSIEISTTPVNGPNTFPAVAVAALPTQPELVAVWVQQGTTFIFSSYRTSGTWSTPAAIPNGFTNASVAVAPLATSGAVLAYKGTDGNLYTSFFSASAWSTPAAAPTASQMVTSTPSVAKGIGGMMAEMAYVDGSGAVWHTGYSGTTWSSPTAIGAGTVFANVAIASGP